MRICILGGGGNVAEAVTSHFKTLDHEIFQFRFPVQIHIPGTPKRPSRSMSRLLEGNVQTVFHDAQELPNFKPQ